VLIFKYRYPQMLSLQSPSDSNVGRKHSVSLNVNCRDVLEICSVQQNKEQPEGWFNLGAQVEGKKLL